MYYGDLVPWCDCDFGVFLQGWEKGPVGVEGLAREEILIFWYRGTMVLWYCGYLVPWYDGILVTWYHGMMVLW